MKFIPLLLTTCLIFGCHQSKESSQDEVVISKYVDPFASETFENGKVIFYTSKTDSKEDLKTFPDGILPWVFIKEREDHFSKIIGKDDIVINSTEASLVITYPLYTFAEIEIKSQHQDGFRRRELIEIISREYFRIFKEEMESKKTNPISYQTLGSIEKLGKYGIWRSDIDNLLLSYIVVSDSNSIKPRLKLMVGGE